MKIHTLVSISKILSSFSRKPKHPRSKTLTICSTRPPIQELEAIEKMASHELTGDTCSDKSKWSYLKFYKSVVLICSGQDESIGKKVWDLILTSISMDALMKGAVEPDVDVS
jgi:hypothetical protein